jgi:hypothetical protein
MLHDQLHGALEGKRLGGCGDGKYQEKRTTERPQSAAVAGFHGITYRESNSRRV